MKRGEVIDDDACQAKYANHHQREAQKALCHAGDYTSAPSGAMVKG